MKIISHGTNVILFILKLIIKIYIILKYFLMGFINKVFPRLYPIMVRNKVDFIKLISNKCTCLEIGPFNKPLLKGMNVKYFDVLNKNALIKRAKQLEIDSSLVPDINFISANGDLKVIDEKFEAILSSHVIEHQPDLIYHLKCIEELLVESGRYFLIIPDQRFTFDYFIPKSNLAQVIEAHIEQRKKHTLTSVIEHRCLTTHNNPYLHLVGAHGAALTGEFLTKSIDMAIIEYNNTAGVITPKKEPI